MVTRWRVLHVLRAWVLALLASGCASDDLLIPPRPEPLIYLVLNQRAFGPSPAVDQRALLLSVGSPLASDYRRADLFELRRVSDGALFVFRDLGQTGRAPVDAQNALLFFGNYALPDGRVGGSMGALDLQPGDSLELTLETMGVSIKGAVRIPPAFALTLETSDDRQRVHWPSVPGVRGYSVEVRGRAAVFQTDTAFVVPSLPSSGADIIVRAMDANLGEYVFNERSSRSGIDGGFGVIGAIMTATVHVSP